MKCNEALDERNELQIIKHETFFFKERRKGKT